MAALQSETTKQYRDIF